MSEENYEKTQAFAAEFRTLVRKYIPEFPETEEGMNLLYSIQDCTSCFSPYVWVDDYKGEAK